MWAYRHDDSKTAVVIPEDCLDVVKVSSERVYLIYGDQEYREFKDDGTLGPEISSLPKQ
jgi:hypothetical protein